MKCNCVEQEQILLNMDIDEVMQLSKLLEEAAYTKENMQLLYDLDQVMFAYYRE